MRRIEGGVGRGGSGRVGSGRVAIFNDHSTSVDLVATCETSLKL